METAPKTVIPPELLAELQAAVGQATSGERDAEAEKKAADRMDRMREELRQRHGEMNIAVDLVRESRDER